MVVLWLYGDTDGVWKVISEADSIERRYQLWLKTREELDFPFQCFHGFIMATISFNKMKAYDSRKRFLFKIRRIDLETMKIDF